MGTGGVSWDSSGLLSIGGSNTFVVENATQSVIFEDEAWWAYTPTSPGLLTVTSDSTKWAIFRGETYDERETVSEYHFTDHLYLLKAGVEYRFLTGWFFLDEAPETYTVTASFEPWYTSDWLDVEDQTQNYLIISDGTVMNDNPNTTYAEPTSRPLWTDHVLRGGHGRRGRYSAQQVSGGDDPSDSVAFECVLKHALQGEQDLQYWNGSTTDPTGDTSPAVCRTLPVPGTPADDEVSHSSTAYSIEYLGEGTVGPGSSAFAIGTASGPSYALWYLPVRDNLPPWGVLTDSMGLSLDPETYGFPEDAELEWEGEFVDLDHIEVADGNPIESGSSPFQHVWALNHEFAPEWNEDTTTGPWSLGDILPPPPIAPPPEAMFRQWYYDDGPAEWFPVPGTEGWSDTWEADWEYVPEVKPTTADGVAIAWPTETYYDAEIDLSRLAQVAVKFVLRARRFRFIYPTPTQVTRPFPPRRGWPRNQLTTAARGLGGQDSIQDGPRGLGAVI